MIGYLEGNLLNKYEDRILLLVNHVGYEVLLPSFVMDTLAGKKTGDPVSMYIYYHQTERQPKPTLIGFNLEAEKEFFQYFISVEAIGPIKAAKALTISIREIARAIETNDVGALKQLKGIGTRTAQKVIATLKGRVEKFALIRKEEGIEQSDITLVGDFTIQVLEVLVNQLGHKNADAKILIQKALERKPSISTPEDLFDEVYRGEVGG
ncbi:MAG: Holliday junction DNA helicase RuvA [Desulfobacteraceae bacterium]|nr:MAG: Holliday junction DNA helicase RuvA [Desulfobacteraceae bacterium]